MSVTVKSKTWRKVKLGDLFELKYGFGLTAQNRADGNIPVYGSSGVVGLHKEARVNKPGIVIGRKGNVGAVYYSAVSFYPIDTVYFIDEPKQEADLRFLYYLLSRIPFKRISSDVGVPGLNRDLAYQLEIAIPEDVDEQKRIADVLSAFDKKIELNNRISRTLEQMAQAIFKEWYMNFSRGELFALDTIADVVKGKKPKQILVKPSETSKEYLLIESFMGNTRLYTEDIILPKSDDYEPIIVMDGASSGKVFVGREGIVGSTLAVIKTKEEFRYLKHFILYLIKKAESELSGQLTGSAIPHVDKDFLKSYPVSIPAEEEMKAFSAQIIPTLEKQQLIQRENQKLAALRDLFLPKLMSGVVRV